MDDFVWKDMIGLLCASEDEICWYLNVRMLCDCLQDTAGNEKMLWIHQLEILPEGIVPGESK